MSAEVADLQVLVSEIPLSPQNRFDEGLDSFLETTRQAFLCQLQMLPPDQVPLIAVDVTRDGVLVKEHHPVVRIPGRLEPGESAYLTDEGDLYAVRESSRPGALDGDNARPLLPREMIEFAPAVFQQVNKLILSSQKKSSK